MHMSYSRRIVAKLGARNFADLASTSSSPTIKPPLRIKRAPTSILNALATTVGHDSTSAPFGFIDDSRLTPLTAEDQAQYLLAKEQGRSTARQIVSDWPTLFMYNKDEPSRNVYRLPYEPALDEQTSTSIDDLMMYMRFKKISQCAKIVNNMIDANIPIPQSMHLQLLTVFAENNCSDPKFDITNYGAHLWYRNLIELDDKESALTWVDGNVADRLFGIIRDKSIEHYQVMIKSLVRYRRPAKASKLYEEMIKNKLTPSTDIYNYAIVSLINATDASQQAVLILQEMSDKSVMPNAGTFEAMMMVCQQSGDIDKCLQILGECTSLNVQPSPHTVSKLLQVLRSDTRLKDVLLQSIHYFQSISSINSSAIDQGYDADYFLNAIQILAQHGDVANGNRLIELANKNGHLITDYIAHKQIYHTYLLLVINYEKDASKIMDTFLRYVPSVLPFDSDVCDLFMPVVRSCLQLGRADAISANFFVLLEAFNNYIPAIVWDIVQQDFNVMSDGDAQKRSLLTAIRSYHDTLLERASPLLINAYLSNGKDIRLDPLTLTSLVLARAHLGESATTVWSLIEGIDVSTEIWRKESRRYISAINRHKKYQSRFDVFLMLIDWMCVHGASSFTQKEIFQHCIHLKKMAEENDSEMSLFCHEASKSIETHLPMIGKEKIAEQFAENKQQYSGRRSSFLQFHEHQDGATSRNYQQRGGHQQTPRGRRQQRKV